MKVVFMGTPEFAVPILRSLLEHYEVAGVVTRPDAPVGRGHKIQYSPIKQVALEHNLPVLQPLKSSDGGFIEKLAEFDADIFVVAAFGMILPERILRLPQYCINVHASLLPKLRGAAPIQWAILNGEKTTGITIMHMDKKLDTGDMILKEEIEIKPDDTGGSLHDKLSEIGASALLDALARIKAGTAERIPQDHTMATYAPMLNKTHGHIDWSKSPEDIENLVRGLNPWSTAYAYRNDAPVKIWRARAFSSENRHNNPGEVTGFTTEGFTVGAGGGSVEILEVQAQGTRRMPAADYLRGHKMALGEML